MHFLEQKTMLILWSQMSSTTLARFRGKNAIIRISSNRNITLMSMVTCLCHILSEEFYSPDSGRV